MTRLDRFVQAAQRRIDAGDYVVSGARLASNGSLREALHKHPTPVIAELKPRSPSEGRLLARPAAEVLDDYVTGNAAAISCLADSDFFDGSPELVRQAHGTGLPVLWKDFIIHPSQIEAAAHHGASAVLLIERILNPTQREELLHAAHAAGLEVLLEVFNAAEAEPARASSADLLGVNARDLETLETDTKAALGLIRSLTSSDREVVALSGIHDRKRRNAAMQAGACAALVGTALMTNPDPRLALRAMQRPLAKLCGMRTEADVRAAASAGADLIGLVVGVPHSPRNLAPVAAQALREHAKSLGLRTVLVTSHPDDWEVREWCRVVKPDYVQLHGLQTTPEWLHSLGAIPTIPIQAVAPGEPVPDGPFILDGSQGTGLQSTWPTDAGKSRALSLVAGGLAPENVADAVERTGAWGADTSSGIETDGVKDPEKMRRFVEACHGA